MRTLKTSRPLQVLWFDSLLALLRIPNNPDFFLVLSTLRLLPPLELRLIEGEWYGLLSPCAIVPGSATDVVLVWIALTTFL